MQRIESRKKIEINQGQLGIKEKILTPAKFKQAVLLRMTACSLRDSITDLPSLAVLGTSCYIRDKQQHKRHASPHIAGKSFPGNVSLGGLWRQRIQPFNTRLPYSKVNSKCLWENWFWIKTSRRKRLCHTKWICDQRSLFLGGNLPVFLLVCSKSPHRFVPVRPCRHLKIIFHRIKNVIPLTVV